MHHPDCVTNCESDDDSTETVTQITINTLQSCSTAAAENIDEGHEEPPAKLQLKDMAARCLAKLQVAQVPLSRHIAWFNPAIAWLISSLQM